MSKHTRGRRGRVFFDVSKEKFANVVYPIMAGVPTTILILYLFDFWQVDRAVVSSFISPVITGIVSGTVLHIIDNKRR